MGPSARPASSADCAGGLQRLARGPPPLVRPPSRRRKGGEPPLSSPLNGSNGVGKEEPPSGAPTPFSGEDGAPLWGPTTHSGGGDRRPCLN
ncbi:hypothetical protein Sjap_015423 [Stephania japonica]|uniref:Uncharacterized protein n=1 Tax=Stephania japonica TaxID=461633 RepID=A0AAP0IKN3_9MAGN